MGDKNVVFLIAGILLMRFSKSLPASGYSRLLENLMRSIPAIRKTTYSVTSPYEEL